MYHWKRIVPINNDKQIQYGVYKEELYRIIHETHLLIGHGKQNI